MSMQQEFYTVPLPYNINQPVEPNAWDGKAHPISIFGTMEFLEIDLKNMFMSLLIWLTILKTGRSKKGK